jgi:hypothetical protein
MGVRRGTGYEDLIDHDDLRHDPVPRTVRRQAREKEECITPLDEEPGGSNCSVAARSAPKRSGGDGANEGGKIGIEVFHPIVANTAESVPTSPT